MTSITPLLGPVRVKDVQPFGGTLLMSASRPSGHGWSASFDFLAGFSSSTGTFSRLEFSAFLPLGFLVFAPSFFPFFFFPGLALALLLAEASGH